MQEVSTGMREKRINNMEEWKNKNKMKTLGTERCANINNFFSSDSTRHWFFCSFHSETVAIVATSKLAFVKSKVRNYDTLVKVGQCFVLISRSKAAFNK